MQEVCLAGGTVGVGSRCGACQIGNGATPRRRWLASAEKTGCEWSARTGIPVDEAGRFLNA